MEDGDSLDSNRIKAVFYALNFGTENLSLRRAKAREFVDCFVEYRDCTHTWTDEDDEEHSYTHTRAYPINDLPTIYANVSAEVGRQVTSDDMANITEIYLRVVYRNFDVGAEMSLEGGNGTHDLIAEMTRDSDVVPSDGGFVSPLPAVGRTKSPPSLVTGRIPLAPAARGTPEWIWRSRWGRMYGR